MRKLVVSMFVTLDGVMEAPGKWSFPYWNDEIARFKAEEMRSSDLLLLGRVTYQGFAAAWPAMTAEQGADQMNGMRKVVVSTTLTEALWKNSMLLKENVEAEIAKLKEQPGQDILVYGSADLLQTLMQHDLVDEYRLLVYPIVLGSGKRLFREGSIPVNLKLITSTVFGSGVVLLTYQPATRGG
jgi:dihydrofolate reductase